MHLTSISMDSIEVNMDRLKEVHKDVQAFKACQKLGLVLDKTMNLLLKMITTDIDPIEMRFELESLSGQREVAWQHDRKSVTPLRKCMYGVSESIEIAIDWLVRREIIKREQESIRYIEIKQEVLDVEENIEITEEIPEEIMMETLEDDHEIPEDYELEDNVDPLIKDEIEIIDEEEECEMRSDRSTSVAKRKREDNEELEEVGNSAKRSVPDEVMNRLDNESDDDFENMIATLKEEPL